VRFWEQVFGVWSRNQVALHDNEHLGVIYEVIGSPGSYGSDEYSISGRKSALRGELQALEDNVRYGVSLSPTQQQLMNTITQGAGQGAVYGAADRLKAQHGMREKFKRGLELSGRYIGPIKQTFREAGLPEDLAYLPHVESSFNAGARSSVGAVGAWQFMPSAGRRFMSVNSAVDERHDPILAAKGATRYLTEAYSRLGDWGLAVTSYNHGMEGMARAKYEVGGGIDNVVKNYHGPSFGFDSRNFYAELLAVRSVVNNVSRYFPEGVNYEAPLNYERVKLPYSVSVPQLSSFYSIGSYQLAQMNPAWKNAAVDGAVDLPANSEVWLPRGTLAQRGPISGYSGSLVAQQSWDNSDTSKVSSAPQYPTPSAASLAAKPYFTKSYGTVPAVASTYSATPSAARTYTASFRPLGASGYWTRPSTSSAAAALASNRSATSTRLAYADTQAAKAVSESTAGLPDDLAAKLDGSGSSTVTSSSSQLSAAELTAEPTQPADEPEEESMIAEEDEQDTQIAGSRPTARRHSHRHYRIAKRHTQPERVAVRAQPSRQVAAGRNDKPNAKAGKSEREDRVDKTRVAARSEPVRKGKPEKASRELAAKRDAKSEPTDRKVAARSAKDAPKVATRKQLITRKESARDSAVGGKKGAKASSVKLVAMNEPKRRASAIAPRMGRSRR
jgi:membrane-bound lytic murein transglycosylase D